MTLVAIGRSIHYPDPLFFPGGNASTATVDATGEKMAMIGRLFIEGRPAGTKTLSTGTISFRCNSVTFANAGTTLDIGIQDVATGAGPIAQPDGTFDVKKTLTGAGGSPTSNAWNTVTMNSGTKSMAHGDLIAIVFDMTARAGADSVQISNELYSQGVSQMPTTNVFLAAAWATTQANGSSQRPNAIIAFDDGTLGWIDCTQSFTSMATETFADATNPDERGLIFQLPWEVKIDALFCTGGVTDANSDFTLKLYSDPTGTPSALATVAVLAETLGATGQSGLVEIPLATEITLSATTDYLVAMLATGSSNVRLPSVTLGNTINRAAWSGGTTLKKATRNNSTGAFTAESPAITMYAMGVRISQFHASSGSSSGLPASRLQLGH